MTARNSMMGVESLIAFEADIAADPREHKNRVWRDWYATKKDDQEYVAKRRAYHAKRRSKPEAQAKLKENARSYRERYRVQRLAYGVIQRCKKSGMECDRDHVLDVAKNKPFDCPCCKRPINYRISTKMHYPIPDGPSMDRIDSSKGYVVGNVAIICWRCNALKRDATLRELKNIVSYMESRL